MNKSRNLVIGLALAALLVFASGAFAKKHESQSASRLPTGSSFAMTAAETNIAEIRMADLAQTKTSSPNVKNLAQHLATDHTKANDQLKQIASKLNLTLPTKMNAKDQAEYDKLSALSGSEFDKTYARGQVKDHKTAIAEFRKEADHGTEPELKQYAADNVSVLEKHLQMAKNAEASVK